MSEADRLNFGNSSFYGEGDSYAAELVDGGVDAWFEELGAQEWIDSHRVASGHILDVQQTAAQLHLPVRYASTPSSHKGQLRGIGSRRGKDPLEAVIGDDLEPSEQRLTFGHEAGHLLIDLLTDIDQATIGLNRRIEAFCEQVGRSMVLPAAELETMDQADEGMVLEIMGHYGVNQQTALIQLMLARKLPRVIAVDTAIGDVANPYYANKVMRHVVCLDCSLCKPHQAYDVNSQPVYDFTGYEWSGHMEHNECSTRRDLDDFKALNIRYGRWTPEDEAIHEDEKERSRVLDEEFINFLASRGDHDVIRQLLD